jgi:prepilin-type N-terminal cleavage/methylation domain-containing protein
VNERGFTLAELLVASAVLGLLMLGVFTVQRQGLSAYQVGSARVEVQQNARAALETMFNEIRTALTVTAVAAPECGTGPVPSGGGATSISVRVAVPDPANPAVEIERTIDYRLTGTTLERREEPAVAYDALIGGVQSVRIWCYNANGVLTATPTLVRSVHIQISTQTESAVAATSDRNQHAVMETRVRLRNLL